MKQLLDFKEEIHKCSKCGLCQSVCPVYEQTRNDCSVSRGKFIMLNGVVKGDLKLNKNINKYLDMCLKCNACKNFCPSDIDARKIFLAAKSEYFKKQAGSPFIKLFQSKTVFKTFLALLKLGLRIYRNLKIDRIVEKLYPLLENMGELGKKVILGNKFVQMRKLNHTPSTVSAKDSSITIVYFQGCVNEYINPNTKNAVETILAKMGINVLPIKFECCGIPFLSCGNAEQFKKQAEYNIRQIPLDFDYFLTDCASCQNAFKEYKNYIEDPYLCKRLDKILEKSINVNEFIIKNVRKFDFKEKTTFTFHKPCHLENMNLLKEFVGKVRGAEYIEMKEFDKCCGFSGEFAIKNTKLSEQISAKKIKNALETKADYILTSCPSCILGLTQGLIENSSNKTPLNLTEFIAMSEIKVETDYENQDCEKKLLDAFVKNCF